MKHQMCYAVECCLLRSDHSDALGFYTYCASGNVINAVACDRRINPVDEGTVSEEHLAWMEYTDHNPSCNIDERTFKLIWTSGRTYGRQQVIEELTQ